MLPVPTFHLPSNSDYKTQPLSFVLLPNHHQHTHTHTLFITILLPLRISCTFASLSPDPALPDSVVHVTAICSHPSQASMPFLIPLMCLSCLSLCQSFFHFFISCRVLLLISKSIYFRYHSQCYFFFVLNDTL